MKYLKLLFLLFTNSKIIFCFASYLSLMYMYTKALFLVEFSLHFQPEYNVFHFHNKFMNNFHRSDLSHKIINLFFKVPLSM